VLKSLAIVGLSLCLSAQAADSGDIAPSFVLPDIRGTASVSLTDYAGKVVYLDFWASWCTPCRQSLPLLSALHVDLTNRGFEVLAIDIDEDPDDGRRFIETYPVGYTVLSDPDGRVAKRYAVRTMPSSFLIDRSGVVHSVHVGFKEKDMVHIRAQIESLLEDRD